MDNTMRRPCGDVPQFQGNPDGIYSGYHDVLCLARRREEARRDNNYQEADRIREELNRRGAELSDTRHAFTYRGITGSYDLHAGVRGHEVQCVALEREEARRDRNYGRADELREGLLQMGVTVDDRSHSARMPDGSACSYDLHTVPGPMHAAPMNPGMSHDSGFMDMQGGGGCGGSPYMEPNRHLGRRRATAEEEAAAREEAARQVAAARDAVARHAAERKRAMQEMPPEERPEPRDPPSPMDQPRGPCGAYGGGSYGDGGTFHDRGASDCGAFGNGRDPAFQSQPTMFNGYTDVLLLAFEREEARRDAKYSEADRIRDELAQRGVDLQDKTHTFIFRDLKGTYDLRTGVGPREVQYAALEREEARRDREYARSDQLRSWLGEQGITVDDKVHTFTMPNGGTGSYDLRCWEPIFVEDGSRGFGEPSIGDMKRRRLG